MGAVPPLYPSVSAQSNLSAAGGSPPITLGTTTTPNGTTTTYPFTTTTNPHTHIGGAATASVNQAYAAHPIATAAATAAANAGAHHKTISQSSSTSSLTALQTPMGKLSITTPLSSCATPYNPYNGAFTPSCVTTPTGHSQANTPNPSSRNTPTGFSFNVWPYPMIASYDQMLSLSLMTKSYELFP